MQHTSDGLVREQRFRHTDGVGQPSDRPNVRHIHERHHHREPRLADIEVTLACPRIDERVQRIVAGLNAFDRKLAGERDGATYRLDIDDVCYAETVDGRTFLYTEDAVYQTPLRLYELEDKLAGTEFVRASKQLLANFDHVVAIRPALNARLQLLLDNGESVMVSRQYAPTIKRKLDL